MNFPVCVSESYFLTYKQNQDKTPGSIEINGGFAIVFNRARMSPVVSITVNSEESKTALGQ